VHKKTLDRVFAGGLEMAYMPEDEKERIKREVSIQRLAEARGIKLRRVGKELIGLCPFHDDRNPSLNIDPAKNVWSCKGACGEGGDVFLWVMRAEGVSFNHAKELLRKNYSPSSGPVVKQSTVPKLPCPVTMGAEDRAVMQEVVGFYHDTLKKTPDALRYLEKRGLKSSEMLERFKLGFSDRMLGPALPDRNRLAGAEVRGQLERLGIFRKESGHEHLRGSLIVPVMNLAGDVVQMYGRKITPNLRAGTPDHLYLPGPMRGVWNEEAFLSSKEIILCEALIDALTFWCAGFRHVTASYGVNGVTDDHRAALRKHGTERVYIAYDHDDAGNKAAVKLAAELMEMGIDCYRVEFPKGMDANAYALKVQPASMSLGVLLNGAAWIGKGLGKGQRPGVPVAVPEIVAAPNEERAAKEKIIEEESILVEIDAAAVAVEETPEPSPTAVPDHVLPLAAVVAVEELQPRPMPLSSPLVPQVKVDGEEVTVTIGPRVYRVLGLEKNTSRGTMRVNVRVSGVNARGELLYHGDTLDMEAARQRSVFTKQTAHELGVKEDTIHREVGLLWTSLGDVQRDQMKKLLEAPPDEALMTADEQAAAMELLRDPRLIERVLADFELCGVVGEETNKKMSYLAAVSRLLAKPLAVVVQSSSAAGKSSLMEAVLDFMPEEQREEYSAMTGQALYYMGQKNLKHKILAVAEEEGASRAAYALKLLQSEGKLKIASTGKDPVNGKMVTHEYLVEGPVMIFLTTTAQDVDEELLNRCLVLSVNEEQEQTRAIHKKQREAQTIEGLWARRDRAKVVRLHRNAQRLLRPIEVANNHAVEMPDFPDAVTRTRRDHTKLLTLIQAIALLHQHQREIKTSTRGSETLEYIEATEEDVKLAHTLIRQVLGPSLDELKPHARRLLVAIDAMVAAESERLQIERNKVCFTRRTVRQYTRWGDTQLRHHMKHLEEMEYLAVKRGGNGQTFVYQLAVDLEGIREGLAEADVNHNRAGLEANLAGGARVPSGGVAGGARSDESPVSMRAGGTFYELSPECSGTGAEEKAVPLAIVAKPKPNGRAHDGFAGLGGAAWQG
jgi:DNA primase catalytic core